MPKFASPDRKIDPKGLYLAASLVDIYMHMNSKLTQNARSMGDEMYAIAATDVSEVTRPKTAGEVVNSHVVRPSIDPKPDFAAMQRTISGNSASGDKHHSGR